MWTRTILLSASLALAICIAPSAFAQNRGGASAFGGGSSGFGSGGMGGFGSSGMGGGFGSGGMGGFGSSGMGGGFGSGGMGGFGSSGMGGGFGSGGMGGSGMGNSGFGGGGFGNSGMGQNNQPGANPMFVGRGGGQNQQNGMNQGGRAMNQFFTNMNRQMSGGNKKSQKGSGSSQNPAQPMRMEIKVAFNPTVPSNDAVATRIQTRLTKILADHHMSQPLVTVQGDTAVISGAAASDSERQTIAQLVSLEQGVRAVRNEMTAPDAPTTEATPPQPGS